MRLLSGSNNGNFSLTTFDDDVPPYAILSHTWGADIDEVNFDDLLGQSNTGKNKSGYRKIQFCGGQARRDGLKYFWVDTCCINKSNNTELAEAITSMFRWYQNAAKCYVYLSDVSTNDHDHADPFSQSWHLPFQKSRWFSRGWTLQELIAPLVVEFFCSNGKRLGDKKSLEQLLCRITRIAVTALQGTDLSTFSVKERMSWAEGRTTKKAEDKAYSLLGLFNINLPLIYGEGGEKAFGRLKEEIYQQAKKRHRDEMSQESFIGNKRAKPSTSSFHDLNALDNEPLSYPPNSVHSIDSATKRSLIDQLYFTKIDEHVTNLTAAQGTTCRWFLARSEYQSWHDEGQQPDHGGFLWIKGNPGTGKSTLMKFLFEEAKCNAKPNSSQIILSFFFLARGTIEEKSTTGLYRSLLHQLFEKAVDLKDSLEWMTVDGARSIQRNGWHKEALKRTLTHAIQQLKSRSLIIFVDALDECDQKQAVNMVCFFEELCKHAEESQVRLQICFSSRYYPSIVIEKGIEVNLERQIEHTEDIEQYIRSNLRLGKLIQAVELRSEILRKSDGIFLWVVLVVDILNFEHAGSSIKMIRERVEQIPPELAKLFDMILIRHQENLEQLHVCLKWILFAASPLNPQELYFAVQLGLDKKCASSWDQGDVNLNQIKSFVRRSSKGLAEITQNMTSKVQTVQFIHESVREYLFGKYEGDWSGVSSNFVGHSHEFLRDCCLAQLNASISEEVDILKHLPHASKADYVRRKFPFFEYSVRNVFHHANSAQQNTIGQAGFLANFPLRRWVLLNNTLEEYELSRYSESVSILYILAKKNCADLIRIYPRAKLCFDVGDECYGPPFFAALATKSNEAVCGFVDILAEDRPLAFPLHDLCKQYRQNQKKWANFGLLFHFSRSRGVYSYVAEYGDDILLSFLIELGECELDTKDENGRTPLWWAARMGHESVVKVLLNTGKVAADSKDEIGRTPLWWAARMGHKSTVKILLETGKVKVNLKDKNGWTPLWWAAMNRHESIVELLLGTGKAEADSKDENGRTILSWAIINERTSIVPLLLETGKVEADSKDRNGRTPLWWATMYMNKSIVKLLLETGKVKADLKDENGRTMLSWAAMKGGESIAKLLVEIGKAEADSKDKNSRTPLWWATRNGHESVVKLLLETGNVDAYSKDHHGRTPLWWATKNGDQSIIKLLLGQARSRLSLHSPSS